MNSSGAGNGLDSAARIIDRLVAVENHDRHILSVFLTVDPSV